MVAYWDQSLLCRFANKAYRDCFGRKRGAVIGQSIGDVLGDDLLKLDEPFIRGVLAGERQGFTRILTRGDGSVVQTWVDYVSDFDANGAVIGFFVTKTDISSLHRAPFGVTSIPASDRATAHGILVADSSGIIVSASSILALSTGYVVQDLAGQEQFFLLADAYCDAGFCSDLLQVLRSEGHWQGQVRIRHKNGGVAAAWLTLTSIRGLLDDTECVVHFYDELTHQRQSFEQARHLALHDGLTGLANRTSLMRQLDAHVSRCETDGRGLGVLFLDLDEFKSVNDTFGHHVGDTVLKIVAQHLLNEVRRSDTVARLGGDEFVILLAHPIDRREVAKIASRLVKNISAPIRIGETMVSVGTSIGIALCPVDGRRPAELLMRSDRAMYAAKRAGKNKFHFYDRGDDAGLWGTCPG